MGDRYYLDVTCPFCKHKQDGNGDEMFQGVWYAPTSGFMTYDCEKCGKTIDLEKYSGIDAEGTASTDYGVEAVREQKLKKKKSTNKNQRGAEKIK